MADFLRRTPMLWFLLPQVLVILLSHYTGKPFNLYKDADIQFCDSALTYRAVICDYPLERKRSWKYTAEVLPERYRTLLYLAKDSLREMPSLYDTIWVHTHWRQAERIGDFDYNTYLRGQGIAATGYAPSRHWQMQGRADTSKFSFKRLRHRLIELLHRSGLSDRQTGTIAAMTLGYKHEMDEDTRQSFQRSGAAHVLAVSGLHTGLIYALLVWLFSFGGLYPPLYEERGRQVLQGMAVIAGLVFYAALTGFSPSVCRAAIMFGLAQTALMAGRQPFSFNTLFAAAFLILFFRPRDLFSVSFQLSFAAVTSIMAMEPPLRRLFPIRTDRHLLHKILDFVRSLLTISFAAQTGTLPLSLYYFKQTSNVFMLTNIVVIPLVTLLVAGVFVFLAVCKLPYIGGAMTFIIGRLTDMLNVFVAYMEQLPHAFTEAVITLPQMLAMYGIIAIFVWLLRRTI